METKNKNIFQDNFKVNLARDLLPKDVSSQKILEERAKYLAKNAADEISKKVMVSFIKFNFANNEYYGVPYQNTLEVIDNITVTKLPHAHASIAGVMNRRGTLLTIVDLKKFLNINAPSSSGYIIIVESHHIRIGLLVDDVIGSDEYDNEILNKVAPYEGLVNSKYILGLHNGTTAILNIEKIICDLEKMLASH